MRVKTAMYEVGNWVYYFCPRHSVGRSPKWQRFYSGPFLVIEKLGPVNLGSIYKHCTETTPASWLGIDSYQVLPSPLEPDALPLMFGGVNRNSPDDVDPNLVARPRRNAAMPARYLCRIYAVPNDMLAIHVINRQRCDCVNDGKCLCFSS